MHNQQHTRGQVVNAGQADCSHVSLAFAGERHEGHETTTPVQLHRIKSHGDVDTLSCCCHESHKMSKGKSFFFVSKRGSRRRRHTHVLAAHELLGPPLDARARDFAL